MVRGSGVDMDKASIVKALRDTAQAASNTAASTVSGPIDLLAAALRYGGVPVPENAFGGSKWMAERGLTQEVEQGVPRVVGETLGMVGPALATQFAPQIAGAINKGAANLAAPTRLNKETGAILAKPFSGPHYATESLSDYTPSLYRETNIEGLSSFGPRTQSQPIDLWFSNSPEYAMGQGANKGVLIEMDAKNVPGILSTSKPMAKQAYESGNAEFVTRAIDPSQLGKNIKSVVIQRDQQTGPFFRRVQSELKEMGLTPEKLPDGSLRYSK